MIEYRVSDGVCILRLNFPPVNAIGLPLLEELCSSIRRANADGDARGIVIIGDDRHFSAGADVNIFGEITKAEDAVRISRVFQEAFAVVEDSRKPVAAAMAGKVMGCALELASACHYRACTADTTFCMPEVTLGINPGAGGTQRLPRLVGLEAALHILLTAETIDAVRSAELGLVDTVCGRGELLESACALIWSPGPPPRTSGRTDKVSDCAVNDAAIEHARKLLAKCRPEISAPRKIVEAATVGLTESFEAGLHAEQNAFAECMDTLATRNKIHVFFATRATSKIAGLETAPMAGIASAAVVGMGTMGAGIAQALLMAGFPVVVLDDNESALEKGRNRIGQSLGKRADRGKIAHESAVAALGLLSTTTDWRDVAKADLVIEAVFEDLAVKRSVLAKIEAVCRAEAIIASNTSTISLDRLAEGMAHPDRLVGMHFFNPAHHVPLVEVIRRDATPDCVIAVTLALAKAIGKTPVLVRNREGFLVNRLFIPYLKEAFYLLEDGATPEAIDSATVEFGFPMGPLALIDMAGLDILVFTDAVVRCAFPAHGPLSPIVSRLVDRGHRGQKTGSGVYKYEKGDYTPHRSEAAQSVIAEVRQELGRKSRAIGADEITERLVLRMIAEALHVSAEQIAQRESDIDAATVLGVGFPDFRGGVLKYARDLGLRAVVAQLNALTERFGERFRPPCAQFTTGPAPVESGGIMIDG
jgi:3-hydroxyacyl-CoA dehydrogenase